MKTSITIKEAKSVHPLASAVLRQLGGGHEAIETAIDAGNHGADAGWCGFTYYKDTCAFTARNRAAIAQAVEALAVDLGEQPIAMVRAFHCLKDNGVEDKHVALALYGGKAHDKDTQDGVDLVENALAWFALEEVGRALESI
jgi:hypothetical protein